MTDQDRETTASETASTSPRTTSSQTRSLKELSQSKTNDQLPRPAALEVVTDAELSAKVYDRLNDDRNA